MTGQKFKSMEIELQTWLEDIKQAIDEIEDFLPKKRDFYQFKNDLKTKKAVERNIEPRLSIRKISR